MLKRMFRSMFNRNDTVSLISDINRVVQLSTGQGLKAHLDLAAANQANMLATAQQKMDKADADEAAAEEEYERATAEARQTRDQKVGTANQTFRTAKADRNEAFAAGEVVDRLQNKIK